MPIGLEEWRASVGSNNAARSHALGKFMRRKSPTSFLSQLISYLVALFTEGTWFASDNATAGPCNVTLKLCNITTPTCSSTHKVKLGVISMLCTGLFITVAACVLCRSGDIETNPGPGFDLDLGKVQNLIWDARTKWFNLGLNLNIDQETLTMIKKTHPNGDDCFREMLSEWLKSVEPSWEELLAALRKPSVRYTQLAKKIAGKFNISNESEDSDEGNTTGRDKRHMNLSEDHKTTVQKKFTSKETAILESQSTPLATSTTIMPNPILESLPSQPGLSRVTHSGVDQKSLSSGDSESKHVSAEVATFTSLHDLQTAIEELEDQFIDMEDRTLDIIKVRGVTIHDFKDHLINLSVRNKEMHKEFLDSTIFTETSDESVKDMWRKLSDYSNFLNYTLVEQLIKKFRDRDLLETMKAYKKKLEIFRSKTRLCDFVHFFKGISKSKEVLMKSLKVKFDENWETCTLQHMEGWKEKLIQKLLLPSITVNPEEISTGCVSITWAIPAMFTPSLVEKLKTLDENFCKEHKIVSLTLDGVEYLGAPDKDTVTHSDSESGISARSDDCESTDIKDPESDIKDPDPEADVKDPDPEADVKDTDPEADVKDTEPDIDQDHNKVTHSDTESGISARSDVCEISETTDSISEESAAEMRSRRKRKKLPGIQDSGFSDSDGTRKTTNKPPVRRPKPAHVDSLPPPFQWYAERFVSETNMEEESAEFKTVKICDPSLQTAFRDLETKLVHFLNMNGFISDDVQSQVLNVRSVLAVNDKTQMLVEGIRRRVSQKKDSYHELVRGLSQGGVHYEPIVKKLNKEYQRQISTKQQDGSVVVKSQDVSFLMNFFCNYAFKWEGIGTALHFQHGELQNIKHSFPIASPQQHLNQLLDAWAQWPNSSHHEFPTVKRLCDALRSDLVGLGAVAKKFHERRYFLPSQMQGNTPAQLSGHSAAHHEVPPVSQSHLFLMAHKIICPQEYAPPSTGNTRTAHNQQVTSPAIACPQGTPHAMQGTSSTSTVRDKDDLNLQTVNKTKFDKNDDFADVVEAVERLAADWAKLARNLGLKYDDIKVIKKNNPGDVQECLSDTMALWLKENYNTAKFGHPSWRTLITAVAKIDMALAKEIANEHRE